MFEWYYSCMYTGKSPDHMYTLRLTTLIQPFLCWSLGVRLGQLCIKADQAIAMYLKSMRVLVNVYDASCTCNGLDTLLLYVTL